MLLAASARMAGVPLLSASLLPKRVTLFPERHGMFFGGTQRLLSEFFSFLEDIFLMCISLGGGGSHL